MPLFKLRAVGWEEQSIPQCLKPLPSDFRLVARDERSREHQLGRKWLVLVRRQHAHLGSALGQHRRGLGLGTGVVQEHTGQRTVRRSGLENDSEYLYTCMKE